MTILLTAFYTILLWGLLKEAVGTTKNKRERRKKRTLPHCCVYWRKLGTTEEKRG
jgi:hypothetical protein